MAAPRRLIGWLSGTPTTTSIPVVVLSDTDAAITISVYTDAALTSLHSTRTVTASTGGGTNPGSGATNGLLTKYCDDRTDAKVFGGTADQPDALGNTYVCWIGRHTLTDLTSGTRYYITLTQGGVVEGASSTDGISTCTAPAPGDDYKLWCLSCDQLRALGHDNDDSAVAAGTRYINAYGYMKRWQSQNPSELAYIWFVDDFGYADAGVVVDTTKKSAGTAAAPGTPLAPQTTQNGYDFGLFYSHGMLGMGEDATTLPMKGGREPNRAWALRNFNMILTQWGDHEFTDQFAYNIGTGPENQPDLWAAATMAWGQLFDHLNSTATLNNLDTDSRHVGISFGDAFLVSPDDKTKMGWDGITETRATASNPAALYASSVSPWYGDDQIDDILTAIDTAAKPFTILGKAAGDKAYCDAYPAVTGHPNHQEMKPRCPDEWSRLFTRNSGTPASLMANSKTNGTSGVLVTWAGDVHLQMWVHHADVADGSNHAENWSAWFTGTVSNHPQVPPTYGDFAPYAFNGGVYDGSKIHYISNSGEPEKVIGDPLNDPLVSCLRIDVNGSTSPKQLICQLYNDGQVVAKAIYEPGSNRPVSPLPWERRGWFSTPSKYVAAAVVSVGLTLTHGSSFVLDGLGSIFGTKTVNGSPVNAPYFHWNGDGTTPTFDYTQGASQSIQNSGWRASTPHARLARYLVGKRANADAVPYNNVRSVSYPVVAMPQEVYASFLVRLDASWDDTAHGGGAGEDDHQMKPCSFQWHGGDYMDSPYLYHGIDGVRSTGDMVTGEWQYSDTLPAGLSGLQAANPRAGWVRVEYVARHASDGFLRLFETTAIAGLGRREVLNDDGDERFSAGALPADGEAAFHFGGYIRDWDTGNNWIYHTDLFLDVGSSTRIVLGNANTLAACTMLEPQPYTAWSASSVTLKGNCGGLTTGSTGYLYVLTGASTTLAGPIAVTIA